MLAFILLLSFYAMVLKEDSETPLNQNGNQVNLEAAGKRPCDEHLEIDQSGIVPLFDSGDSSVTTLRFDNSNSSSTGECKYQNLSIDRLKRDHYEKVRVFWLFVVLILIANLSSSFFSSLRMIFLL